MTQDAKSIVEQHHFLINEEKPDHYFRTEMPNIIYALGLDPYEFRVYGHLKSVGGDKGGCWQSLATIQKETQISRTKIQACIKKLSSNFELLNNGPLIKLITRKKESGESETNVVVIVDIWRINGEYYRKNSKKDREVHLTDGGGGSPPEIRGSPPKTPKEERYKKIYIKNDKEAEQDLKHEKKPAKLEIQETDLVKADDDRSSASQHSNVSFDRSSASQYDIVSFDPETYKFPDGTRISDRMKNGIKKYTQDQFKALQDTIFYFEEQIAEGRKPKNSYEQMLQSYINGKYAEQAQNIERNRREAIVFKGTNDLPNVKVLKTVVQYRGSSSEPWETVSLNLPSSTLDDCLKNYMSKLENK